MKKIITEKLEKCRINLFAFFKWLLLALLTGLICGGIGCVFHFLIEQSAVLREENDWMLFLLPFAGIVIVAVYQITKQNNVDGTNFVIEAIRKDGKVPAGMAPAIVFGTVMTHLFGGSAGREGAALQLGGSIGSQLGKLFRLDKYDMHVIVLCGMSAVFSALFGTPLTAVIFVMEIISVGIIYYSAIMPCVISSVVAYYIAMLANIEPVNFKGIISPDIAPVSLLQSVGLGIVFALLSIAFCIVISRTKAFFKKYFTNPYLRIAVGALFITGLSFLLCTRDYNGAGMEVINRAILDGQARPEAFVLKMILTAITLGCGFRGGEIVPAFYVGATFGCVFAPLIGVDAGFGAAIGLAAVFCGVTNAPIASIVLGVELFGAGLLPYIAIACSISYMLSGYFSLYKSQIIVYDKLKAVFINKSTNK